MAADGNGSFRPDKDGHGTFRSPVSVLGFGLEGSLDASAPAATTFEPGPGQTFGTAFGVEARPQPGSDIDQLLSELRLTTDAGLPIPPHSTPSGPPPVLVHHNSLQSLSQHCSTSPASRTPMVGSSEPRSQRQLRSCKSLPVAPYHGGFEVGSAGPMPHRPHTPHGPHRSINRTSYSGDVRGLQRPSMDGSMANSSPPSPSANPRFRGPGAPRAGGINNRAGRGGDSPRHRNYRKLWSNVCQVKRGGRLGDSEVGPARRARPIKPSDSV